MQVLVIYVLQFLIIALNAVRMAFHTPFAKRATSLMVQSVRYVV